MESFNYSNYSDYSDKIYKTINQLNVNEINYENFDDIIKDIEKKTFCKIYNKENILLNIKNNNPVYTEILKLISINSICHVDYNYLFANDKLNFSIIFYKDSIKILYKNKIISNENISEIKKDLLLFPDNYLELYVDTIIQIICKLVDMNLSVIYNLDNFNKIYYKLFELKCKNKEKNILYFDKIINPKTRIITSSEYTKSLFNLYMKDDKKIRDELELELEYSIQHNSQFKDIYYKLDQINYINLYQNMDDYKRYCANTLTSFIELVNINPIRSIKHYIAFKLYIFINLNIQFVKPYKNLKLVIYNKQNEFRESINISPPHSNLLKNNILRQFNIAVILLKNK